AHRLSGKVLAGLRLLSNLDTDTDNSMCLLLVGQPELEQKLATRAFRPLRQRISVRYRLESFTCQETRAYIRHRLHIADARHRFHLGEGVLWLIYAWSSGVPRRINQLCDRALLAAYAQGSHTVTPRMIWRASKEFMS
ncbi:MAG: hypothetical protein KC592_03180, partial [Nitrospira sp.]|nr:hypothetical protein [Nitrospira sp.]